MADRASMYVPLLNLREIKRMQLVNPFDAESLRGTIEIFAGKEDPAEECFASKGASDRASHR